MIFAACYTLTFAIACVIAYRGVRRHLTNPQEPR